jgi:hypothetical protein
MSADEIDGADMKYRSTEHESTRPMVDSGFFCLPARRFRA